MLDRQKRRWGLNNEQHIRSWIILQPYGEVAIGGFTLEGYSFLKPRGTETATKWDCRQKRGIFAVYFQESACIPISEGGLLCLLWVQQLYFSQSPQSEERSWP